MFISCDVTMVKNIINKMESYVKNPNSFVYDAEKEAKEKEALEIKKWEEGKRKRYEERMQRKAKRGQQKPRDARRGQEKPGDAKRTSSPDR